MVKAQAHYVGHRQRLRERFDGAGEGALAEYELLELLLFKAIPRGDLKPMAKALLKRFGSFSALLAADPGLIQEISGAGPSVVHLLKLVRSVSLCTMSQDLVGEDVVLDSWKKVVDYCTAAMAHNAREELRLLFLDRKNKLIKDEVQQTGTVDHTPLYPREVVKRALDLGASAIIMAHNHPSGDPTPSKADINMTIQVDEAARALGIKLHDHIIVAKKGHSSLRSMGLF